MDRTGGAAAFGRGPTVVSIILGSMVMVLDCPCLALEAKLIQNLLIINKPLTKFDMFNPLWSRCVVAWMTKPVRAKLEQPVETETQKKKFKKSTYNLVPEYETETLKLDSCRAGMTAELVYTRLRPNMDFFTLRKPDDANDDSKAEEEELEDSADEEDDAGGNGNDDGDDEDSWKTFPRVDKFHCLTRPFFEQEEVVKQAKAGMKKKDSKDKKGKSGGESSDDAEEFDWSVLAAEETMSDAFKKQAQHLMK